MGIYTAPLKTLQLVAFTALAALASTAAPAEVPESFRVFSVPVLASVLIGMPVTNARGRPIGSIADLMFDLRNNRVHYAEVELDGRSERYPMHALKLSRARHQARLETDDLRISQAWNDMRLVRASRLIPQPMRDVVVDAFWGNVAFAAVESGGLLRPVPLDAFEVRRGEPVLGVERRRLDAQPGFTAEELSNRVNDRDFLQRYARHAHRLTPIGR